MNDDLGLICAVPLERMVYLDARRLERALRAHAPGRPVQVLDRLQGADASGLLVILDGHHCAVMAVDGRLPEPEFAGALAENPLWPAAADRMRRHRAFIIVTLVEPPQDHADVRAQAATQTRLAAVLCELFPALGAYWPGAAAAVPPERVRRAVEGLNQNRWPADLWIGYEFRGTDADGGGLFVGIRSKGAARFIGAEVEVPPRHVRDRAEAILYLDRAVADLLTRGRRIRDGEPVRMGERNEAWHQVRYVSHGEVSVMALRELEEPIWGLANVST